MLGTLSYAITAKTAPLKSKLNEAKQSMNSTDKAMKQAGGNIAASSEKMSKSAGDALAPMEQGLSAINPAAGQAVQGLKSMSMGAKALNMALGPIGIMVGVVAAAIAGLTAYFRGSVEGQERMARITGYLSGILDGLKDVLIDLGGWLVKVWDDPKQAVKDLWSTIKNFFIAPFQGMVGMVTSGWRVIQQGAKGVGLAIKGIFDAEAREQSKLAFAEMRQGMEDFTESAKLAVSPIRDAISATKEWGKEINKRAQETADLAARETALRIRQTKEQIKIAKLDAQIAAAREISNDMSRETTEQMTAQERAMDLVEEKYKIQISQAQEALAIQRERMALGHDGIEDLEKEATLNEQLIRLQQSRSNEQRNLLRRHGTLLNQIEAEEKAVQEAIEKERQARQAAIDEQIAAKESILEKIRQADMTEIELAEERMQQMLEAHEWSEEERYRITEHWENKIRDLRLKSAEEAIAASEETASAFQNTAAQVGQGYAQMAAAGQASTAQLVSQAFRAVIAELIKSIMVSVPFPANIGVAAGAGTIAGALWNQIPGMAQGGVVPPGYPNDSYLARLTSGETITPPGQLETTSGEIRVRIEGDALVGILEKRNLSNIYF